MPKRTLYILYIFTLGYIITKPDIHLKSYRVTYNIWITHYTMRVVDIFAERVRLSAYGEYKTEYTRTGNFRQP